MVSVEIKLSNPRFAKGVGGFVLYVVGRSLPRVAFNAARGFFMIVRRESVRSEGKGEKC